MKLSLVIDVDGVLTTGQFLYSPEGKTHKIFGPHDADGLKLIRDQIDIHFITADQRGLSITQKRIQDMGFTVAVVPEADRFEYVSNRWTLDQTIYIGDGIHDARLLKESLYGIAPASARTEARQAANYVTPSNAAEGAVLDACLKIKKEFLESALLAQLIDVTPSYTYERIRSGTGKAQPVFTSGKHFHTLYLHTGQATIEIQTDTDILTQPLTTGQGWYATPGTSWRILPDKNADIFHVYSQITQTGPIIQIVDDGQTQREEALNAYGIIDNPKKVDKPWGHELWIMWSRDYHVLKQIAMTAGNQSSLQIHRHKLETNYLVSGQADVIDQLPLDTTASETAMSQALAAINLNEYKESKTPGMHWTSSPGIVHRVIAASDYMAYETSTPQLDDVVRLQDDTNRESGRITSEHRSRASSL